MRQIVLDTETTGLEVSLGHRIIEIGCVELIDRRITDNHWHYYINPDRDVEHGAYEVHGISNEFLQDKPRFHDLSEQFLAYIDDAELVIHNAPFDVGFLDFELGRLAGGPTTIHQHCNILDTLVMARQKHPGQKNSLDALCKRYEIDNRQRSLHGALLDARILSEVYLAMTGGQTALGLDQSDNWNILEFDTTDHRFVSRKGPLPVWQGDEASAQAHLEYVKFLQQQSEEPVWE